MYKTVSVMTTQFLIAFSLKMKQRGEKEVRFSTTGAYRELFSEITRDCVSHTRIANGNA